VKIRNFLHKPLKRFYEESNTRGLPSEAIDKLRKMLAYLDGMDSATELKLIPGWRAHVLTGDRKGTWSLMVTRNWRLTFTVDDDTKEISDVNYEDYH
jgi:proteic killer suppression protein